MDLKWVRAVISRLYMREMLHFLHKSIYFYSGTSLYQLLEMLCFSWIYFVTIETKNYNVVTKIISSAMFSRRRHVNKTPSIGSEGFWLRTCTLSYAAQKSFRLGTKHISANFIGQLATSFSRNRNISSPCSCSLPIAHLWSMALFLSKKLKFIPFFLRKALSFLEIMQNPVMDLWYYQRLCSDLRKEEMQAEDRSHYRGVWYLEEIILSFSLWYCASIH